ncbi:MAG: hypothetical protein RIS70_3730 [Planctomycetota bacterium]
MDEIVSQVQRARRRLVLQQFLQVAPWVMFGALLVAVIGLAIPKIWVIPGLDSPAAWQRWVASWVGGSTLCGLFIAVIWTFLVRRNALDAAIELDRRFGLKERVSTSLALTTEDRESQIGRALLDDASRRVAQVRVSEQFVIAPGWRVMIPLAPIIAMVALVLLVENASSNQKKTDGSESRRAKEEKLVAKSREELRKKLAEQKQKLDEKGLAEARDLFNKMQNALDKQMGEKEKMDRKEALVRLNDLGKELEKRREEIGGSEKLKQQLQQMKSLEKGPADRMADAFKQGNFKQAIEEAKRLQEKMAKGELTPEQQQQLAKQLDQMEKKLKALKEAHEQAKQELSEQIKKKMDQGDLAEASKLQKQLDKLTKMDQQMEQLDKLAQKCAEASKAAEQGQTAQAASQMSKMIEDMQQMENQMAEMEAIEQMMDQLADAKDAMNCENCNGEGCAKCLGKGSNRQSKQQGRGLGEGQGQGDRPEERTDTGGYDTRVVGKPRAGEAVKSGFADGANIAGKSKDEIREQVSTNLKSDPDPLPNQPLPKAQRENVRQYFESYQSKGEKKPPESKPADSKPPG